MERKHQLGLKANKKGDDEEENVEKVVAKPKRKAKGEGNGRGRGRGRALAKKREDASNAAAPSAVKKRKAEGANENAEKVEPSGPKRRRNDSTQEGTKPLAKAKTRAEKPKRVAGEEAEDEQENTEREVQKTVKNKKPQVPKSQVESPKIEKPGPAKVEKIEKSNKRKSEQKEPADKDKKAEKAEGGAKGKAPENGNESPESASKKPKRVPVQPDMPLTFARRYCPDQSPGREKWVALQKIFTKLISPDLEAGTKTKIEVDFWRYMVAYHKDQGGETDAESLNRIFAAGAKKFLKKLNAARLRIVEVSC